MNRTRASSAPARPSSPPAQVAPTQPQPSNSALQEQVAPEPEGPSVLEAFSKLEVSSEASSSVGEQDAVTPRPWLNNNNYDDRGQYVGPHAQSGQAALDPDNNNAIQLLEPEERRFKAPNRLGPEHRERLDKAAYVPQGCTGLFELGPDEKLDVASGNFLACMGLTLERSHDQGKTASFTHLDHFDDPRREEDLRKLIDSVDQGSGNTRASLYGSKQEIDPKSSPHDKILELLKERGITPDEIRGDDLPSLMVGLSGKAPPEHVGAPVEGEFGSKVNRDLGRRELSMFYDNPHADQHHRFITGMGELVGGRDAVIREESPKEEDEEEVLRLYDEADKNNGTFPKVWGPENKDPWKRPNQE